MSTRARNCRDVAVLLGVYKTHNLGRTEKGIRKFHREHGKVPSLRSGDATPYLGYQTTWSAVGWWLHSRGHGTLSQLCKRMGLRGRYVDHSFESLEKGIRKFTEEHGRPPSRRDGDAFPYVGYETTWAAVGIWIRRHGGGTLFQQGHPEKAHFRRPPITHVFGNIEKGIRKFHGEHGRRPSEKSGEAFQYLGYAATWVSVARWLKKQGRGSLQQLCDEMGGVGDARFVRRHLTLEKIRQDILSFFDKKGVRPSRRTMGPEDGWLKRAQGTSLSKLCNELGLPGGKTFGRTVEKARAEIQTYYDERGVRPSERNLTPVALWLRKRGTSLFKLCNEMGLK